MVQVHPDNEQALRKRYVDLSWSLKERIDEATRLETEFARLKGLKTLCDNEAQKTATLKQKLAGLRDRSKSLTASIPLYKMQLANAKQRLASIKTQTDSEQSAQLQSLREETAILQQRLDATSEQLQALQRMPNPEPTPALKQKSESVKEQLAKRNQKLATLSERMADLQDQLRALAAA